MTTFKKAIQICGLSQKEAADFLDVRIDTVKSWSSNRNPVPRGVWNTLSDLYWDIQEAGDFGANVLENKGIGDDCCKNIAIDPPELELPNESTKKTAGAMALLIALNKSR